MGILFVAKKWIRFLTYKGDNMNIIKFKGCKHLIFDKAKIDNRCTLSVLDGNLGAYWERDSSLLPHKSCAINVQFCSKRGRLNSKVACLKDMAECELYEEITHTVVI